MLTSTALFVVWAGAAALSGFATWRMMLNADSTRLEALVAGGAVALVTPAIAASWILLLPLRFSISAAFGCVILMACSLLALRSRWGRPRGRPERLLKADLLAALPAAVVMIGAGVVSVYAAWIKPVWEIDGLLYHGPAAANLLQHGSLFGWDAPSPWIFYPNLAAIQEAATAVVGRTVALMDGAQAPYLVLIGFVVWAWAGRGRPRALVGAVACIAVLTPAAFIQGRALYVDVIYAGVLVTGLWLIGLWISRGSRVHLGLGVLFLGSAAAVKPSGATIGIVLLLGVLAFAALRRRRGWSLTALVACSGMAIGAVPFYLRNIIEFHNPIYPVKVAIAGINFPGLLDLSVFYDNAAPPQLSSLPGPVGFFRNLAYSVTDPPVPLIYDSRLGAFGQVVAILAVLAIVAVGALIWPATDSIRDRLRPFAWPIVAFGVVLLLQPQAWNPRYVLAAFSILVILIGLGIDRIRAPKSMAIMLTMWLLTVLGAMTYIAESSALESITGMRAATSGNPRFNAGVTGTNPAYQDQYAWLAGAPCGTRVVVAGLDMQAGLLNAYSFPMWGDGLCNVITVARDVRHGGGDFLHGDRRNLQRLVPHADYVVAFEADRALVKATAAAQGLKAVVVSDPPDYFGADQVVFRITKQPRK